MISCSKCKKATLPVSDGGCIRTGGVVDIGCEYGEPRIITNYDRIVSKSPEELAEWIAGSVLNLTGGSLKMATEAWLDWLKQEAVSDG